MNKKSFPGLILFAVLITACLLLSADYLSGKNSNTGISEDPSYTEENTTEGNIVRADASELTPYAEITSDAEITSEAEITPEAEIDSAAEVTPDVGISTGSGEIKAEITPNTAVDTVTGESWLSANPSDTGVAVAEASSEPVITVNPEDSQTSETEEDTLTTTVSTFTAPELIYDSSKVDYKAFIPEMVINSELEAALSISNPDIDLDAEAAILFDATTKEVLYYKNPVQAEFPASTVKLLTALVALQWCKLEEEVTIKDEITMIAPDSTTASLKEGQILTIQNLLEGMLLPSGNDAAYAVAAYVGRKSLDKQEASKEEAITEFVHLMNEEAVSLGVKNSCFKTPDGYDAVGQYTTAYDMGLIGIAAAGNSTITQISHKSSSRNIFVSGEDVTWDSTNKLVTRYSGQYYSPAIGLKTGTSTMAGRCLIAAAERDGKKVVCVIMDSTSSGRWEDAIALLKYGLK